MNILWFPLLYFVNLLEFHYKLSVVDQELFVFWKVWKLSLLWEAQLSKLVVNIMWWPSVFTTQPSYSNSRDKPDLLESSIEPKHEDWQEDTNHPGTAVNTEGYLIGKFHSRQGVFTRFFFKALCSFVKEWLKYILNLFLLMRCVYKVCFFLRDWQLSLSIFTKI